MRFESVWTLGVLFVIVAVFAITTADFLTKQAWLAISIDATEVMLLAIGQTFVIVSRGIDLSVGAILGFAPFVGAWMMSKLIGHAGTPETIAVGFGVTIAVGLTLGLVNGFVITKMRITPFIATLGMLGIATGATDVLNGGQEISNIPPHIVDIGNAQVLSGWIAIPVLVTAVVALASGFALSYCRFGRRCYAVGSSPEASLRAGISVDRHLIAVYVVSGGLAALSGFLVMSRLGVASVAAGQNDELNAIAAVVIGGASLFGGRGTIVGAVLGTLIIAVLNTGLIIANVDPSWQVVAVGLILIAAVWADQQRVGFVQRMSLRSR
ncbi:MAG: ABC transporter permease [Solirubrobacteraceae bacterium]